MKEYNVGYYIGTMYHCYNVEAENEASAIKKVLNRLPEQSLAIMHSFAISRYYPEWN